MSHAETVDRIYRHQRHLYDSTRRFTLIGRNTLMDTMNVSGGEKVLEMGCGTGRNLIRLARRHPKADLFGIDASNEMLATARRKIAAAHLSHRITLATCLAEDLSPQALFGAPIQFDKIFFSYSLSMMPNWQDALTTAFEHLAPSGTLHVLDFWDQENWPNPIRRLLNQWLSLFQVRFDPEMIPSLSRHFTERGQTMSLTSIARRYAFLAAPKRAATK